MKVTTSTGVVLDTEGGWAKLATDYAHKKGLTGIIITMATHKDGSQEYLMLENNKPIYGSQKFEDICFHIDTFFLYKTVGREKNDHE
jgi:hypothetical protein